MSRGGARCDGDAAVEGERKEKEEAVNEEAVNVG